MTTRDIVRDKALARYGLLSNDQRIPTATQNEFVQTALNRLSNMDDWWWLRGTGTVNTIAGQRAYVLVGDLSKLKMMWWNDSSIAMIQPERAVEMELMRGVPRYFYLSGTNVISVYPLPQEVYQLQYLYFSTDITIVTGSETLKLPDRYEDLLVSMVCSYFARRLNDTERENEFKEEIALLLPDAKRSNMRSQGQLLPRRRRDWTFYG